MRQAMHVLVAVTLMAVASPSGEARADSFETQQKRFGRVRTAFSDHEATWKARFTDHRAAWPPRAVHLRAFKAEGQLELWAAAAAGDTMPLVRVHTFPICASSGGVGLKRQSGDGQVPEGFYRVDRFNPRSSFLLSLGLDYPNAWDKARAARDALPPGGDIFVHGGCATIGCLPLGDDAIEGLYLVAVKARSAGQGAIHVTIAPCRFGEDACERRLADHTSDEDTRHAHKVLRVAQAAFAATGHPPDVRVSRAGYALKVAAARRGGRASSSSP